LTPPGDHDRIVSNLPTEGEKPMDADATVAPRRDALVQLLRDLVAIDSVNPYFPGGRGEAEIASYVADYCAGLGLPVRRQEILPGRPNVTAELIVPGATRTLLFDSHLDTVSLDQMGPAGLQPTIRDGVLTGRGACDTKASLAAMLAALAALARNPAGLGCNVLFLGSVDEEYLMRGAEAFARSGVHVDAAIVGEPTRLEIVVAHKGFVRWRLHTLGRAAHSSDPGLGDNAIYQMADLIRLLRAELEPRYRQRVHPLVGPATWSVGKITGGSSVNIVPNSCTIEIDRRLLPSERSTDALAEFDAVIAEICQRQPGLRVRREEPFADVAGLETPASAPIVRALEVACGTVRGEAKITGVPYGTNASKFAAAGITCVVFGPGDVARAHTAEEFVPLDEVVAAAAIYEAAARAF
jgi:succinyl-diaminopimelate desuccinylase